LNSTEDSYSLYVVLIKQPCLTTNENPDETWKISLIIIGSVVGVALIFLVIVLAVPPLRKKNISFRKKEIREIQEKRY